MRRMYILLGAPAKIGPDTNSHKLVLLAARFVRNADWLLEQCHRIWLTVGINGSWKRLFLGEWSAVSGEKDFAVFFIVLRSRGRKICLKMCMEIQKIQLVVQDLLYGTRIFFRVSIYFRIMLLHISWMLLLNVNYNLHNLK